MFDPRVKIQVRRLIGALMVSGAINIVLLMLLFTWVVKDNTPNPYYELKPANKQQQQLPLAVDHSNSDVIRYLRVLPMQQLIARLNQPQMIENGYAVRDLALAVLVDFYHFDLTRALKGHSYPEQKRVIVYGKRRGGKNAELTVYPGLSDEQFQAIVRFAATEKWPLTSQGLFLALSKRSEAGASSSLTDAFYMTPEFLTVEMLFGRAEVPVEKKEQLQVLLQGDWETLSSFVEQQRTSQDLSSARRQRFLVDYIRRKSTAAAKLFLKTDKNVAVSRLDDNHVILILRLLEEKSSEGESYALSLLTSPRSDAVWKMAAAKLYSYAGEQMPEKYHHHAALSRFVSKEAVMALPDEGSSLAIPIALMSSKKMLLPEKKTSPGLEINSDNGGVKDKNLGAVSKKPQPKAMVATVLPEAKPSSASKTSTKTPTQIQVKPGRVYIVQEGDSLWKIARRFHVEVEQIKSYNRLKSDSIKPGRPLIIP